MAILGGDSEALAAADQVLGGVLSSATGGASDAVLGLFGAQGRLLRTGRDALGGLRDRLGSAERAERTEKIAAAHAVLVVVALFEVLDEAELPFRLADVELTRNEQISLVGGDANAAAFVQVLLATEVPLPSPVQPYEATLHELRMWCMGTTGWLLDFVRGLAV